ncbi:MAG: nitroreductase family protein [Bacteroidales bacterium]|nr:nitroreductase family protein [Bacteroidales bacterium]
MLETIFNHRSIRKYKSDPIDDLIMNKIVEAGTRASTTGNMQVYSMVITRDERIREKLWMAHFRQDMVLQAPVHITFCADFNRFNKWCLQRNARPGYDNFLSFFTAAIDALLVSQNVVLAAEAHGLGICYLGTVIYMADRIAEILELPVAVVPVAAIVMGYPDEIPEMTDRLPLKGVIHKEKYSDYSAEAINEIYAGKEALELTAQLLKENNKETLAQVFTDNRYPRKDNVHFSNRFLRLIENQGFMNNEE